MNTRVRSILSSVVLVSMISACGFSVYSPVTPESSEKAQMEKAILAMNKGDYATARTALREVWKEDKSNKTSQLYANAILGDAGFDLYDIILQVVKSATNSDLSSANDVLEALSDVLTVEASARQLDDLNLTLSVLNSAENQSSKALEFQKCLIVGIYAVPVLSGITESISNIQSTLDALPQRLAVDPTDSRTCTASTEVIEGVGSDLSSLIGEIGSISSRLSDINTVIQNCSTLSENAPTDSVNGLTTQVDNVIASADRGCTLPETGVIGSRIFPSCMSSYLEESSESATAGDGVVSGCEVFLNCSQGNCTTGR